MLRPRRRQDYNPGDNLCSLSAMQHSLDIATLVGGSAFAISAIVLAWISYHWQAIRRRELSPASLLELLLLVLFVVVVIAWIVESPWSS